MPSHIGITGNELADKAARSAVTGTRSLVELKTVNYDFKAYVKTKILAAWQTEWSNSQSKLIEVKPSTKPWQQLPTSRTMQVTLCRLRIGHTKKTHSYLLAKTNQPICDTCQEVESIKHNILINCPKYSLQRKQHNLKLTIYANLNGDANINNLMNFLKDCNLINQI